MDPVPSLWSSHPGQLFNLFVQYIMPERIFSDVKCVNVTGAVSSVNLEVCYHGSCISLIFEDTEGV
jgi:hypothetical protein